MRIDVVFNCVGSLKVFHNVTLWAPNLSLLTKIPREGNWVRFSCSNSALVTAHLINIWQMFNLAAKKSVFCWLCITSEVILLEVHPDTIFYEQYNKCIAIIVTRVLLIHGPVGLGPNLNRSNQLLYWSKIVIHLLF